MARSEKQHAASSAPQDARAKAGLKQDGKTPNQSDLWPEFQEDLAANANTNIALDASNISSSTGEPRLKVDVDGFEGPLDLLLELARRQKVDLARISILALAEQYLEFIEEIRRLRIELAADYLVMAAWLAFLKSKLLLPDPVSDEEPTGEELAAILAHRLRRLEAMRQAGERLINRNRLGRDYFARGAPEPVLTHLKPQYSASLFDLLTAYANQRQRQGVSAVTIAKREVWSLAEAREILERMVGSLEGADGWTRLDTYLMKYVLKGATRRSAIASSFAASLELVREGRLAMKQEKAFAPIFLKKLHPLQKQEHKS